MKKIFLSLVIALLSISQSFGMSVTNIRTHARFLSDRMAYELDLTPGQYDDIYEINYDFIFHSSRIMDDVVYGYRDAIDTYYELLDERNDDIRYVLSNLQYSRFLTARYFYRPIYNTGRTWSFRIYTIYNNHNFFYYDAPSHYRVYAGAHSRRTLHHHDYYSSRYHHQAHDRYGRNDHFIRNHQQHHDIRRNDFGANVRERHNAEHNKVNNYNNAKSNNRTQNKYYRDNSGNKHAQDINSRNHHGNGKPGQPQHNNAKPGQSQHNSNAKPSQSQTRPSQGGNSGSHNSNTRGQNNGNNGSRQHGTVPQGGRR